MRCPTLPEPRSAEFEALRLWAFDAAQKYEICAGRLAACASGLEARQ